MQYKFNKQLENLLPGGPYNILVAVSGGADSMCLLDLLHNCSLDLTISIAHMNFNLRGADSDSDEALVREWAASNGVRIFVKGVDTKSYAAQNGISIEMAARDLRYEWFHSLKKEYGFHYIALAHHANDNAETLILNLLRGTGVRGICGMKEIDQQRGLLRPLLGYTRKDIERYVSKRGIRFAVDCTNANTEFHRNRIRNVVIPELEKINPQAVNVLNRDMAHFTLAAGILGELAQRRRDEIVHYPQNGKWPVWDGVKSRCAKQYMRKMAPGRLLCAIDVAKLLEDKNYRYWLYEILSGYEFNSKQIEDMAGSLEHSQTSKIAAGGFVAVKERGYIKVYKQLRQALESGELCGIGELKVSPEIALGPLCKSAVAEFGGKRVLLSLEGNGTEAVSADAADTVDAADGDSGITLSVSASKIKFPLMLRYVGAGDKWSPFGMKGAKKVSDYLTDIKLDSEFKGDLLVLCSKNNPSNIICLPGLEISESYRVGEDDPEVLRITLL